ncbi:MAG: TIGR04211 family SH3 domain-containing protein [Desulfobacterales bacterium]
MKLSIVKIFLCVNCLFLLYGSVAAGTKYVREILYVTLREAPGLNHKVITTIPSGQELEILKADNEWTQVKIANGTTGWVLSRYVTSKLPSSYLVSRLKAGQETLLGQAKSMSDKNKNLQAELQRLKEQSQNRITELENAKQKLTQASRSYGDLKKDSAGYLQLKTNYEKTVAQLSEAKKTVEKYQKALEKIEFRNDVKWFLSGAGVLVFGFLIGLSARPRRKSSLH